MHHLRGFISFQLNSPVLLMFRRRINATWVYFSISSTRLLLLFFVYLYLSTFWLSASRSRSPITRETMVWWKKMSWNDDDIHPVNKASYITQNLPMMKWTEQHQTNFIFHCCEVSFFPRSLFLFISTKRDISLGRRVSAGLKGKSKVRRSKKEIKTHFLHIQRPKQSKCNERDMSNEWHASEWKRWRYASKRKA